MYLATGRESQKGLLVLRVTDTEEALEVLKEK